MTLVRNPITHRLIDRDGRTADILAVRYRLMGRTFGGNKHSGCGGRPVCHGSKLQVWHGTAKKTLGGVPRDGLFQDKNGRIRFKSRSLAAKRNPEFMARAKAVKAQYSGGRSPSPRRSARLAF